MGVSVLRGQGVGLPTVKVSFWPGVRTRATAILADGTEVEDHGRGGSRMEDGSWYVSFDWPVPLDVTDIIAIRFGDTEIPLN